MTRTAPPARTASARKTSTARPEAATRVARTTTTAAPHGRSRFASLALVLAAFLQIAHLLPPLAPPARAEDLLVGNELIVGGELYAVHSAMSRDGAVVNTSNIYVVRGAADSVWIFGMGYGNKTHLPAEPSDVSVYRRFRDASRTAYFDAAIVDSIIRFGFGLTRDRATLMFIVPHFHFDHVNKEFVAALLEKFRYPGARARIVVHTNDYLGAACNAPCCGDSPCDPTSPYFGSPFKEPWVPEDIARFTSIGTAGDACNEVVFSFDSPSGLWEVRKGMARADGGHTDGTVNLDNAALRVRIVGADAGVACPVSAGTRILWIHGDNAAPTSVGAGSDDRLASAPIEDCVSAHGAGPNPFGRVTTIRYSLARAADVRVTIYDTSGRAIRTLLDARQTPGSWTAIWDGRDDDGRVAPAGAYVYRLAADGGGAAGKLVLVR